MAAGDVAGEATMDVTMDVAVDVAKLSPCLARRHVAFVIAGLAGIKKWFFTN